MVRILAMREIISKALDLGLKRMIMLVGSRQIEKKNLVQKDLTALASGHHLGGY
jgi:hypothetical protein